MVNVLASLKLKIDANRGDPKLLVNAMKFCLGAEDLNTNACFLENSKLFGSTKWKLDLPPNVDYDSHRPNNSELLDALS